MITDWESLSTECARKKEQRTEAMLKHTRGLPPSPGGGGEEQRIGTSNPKGKIRGAVAARERLLLWSTEVPALHPQQ